MKRAAMFKDRAEAGRQLAERLQRWRSENPVILALPRGGVPVAVVIARALEAPLDLVLVRKIGVPGQPELAAAAVVDGSDAELVTNDDVIAHEDVRRSDIAAAARTELAVIERRRRIYLEGYPRVPLQDRALILVDDGIATGASIRAAIAALQRKSPRRLILAVPVAPSEAIDRLKPLIDHIVCLAEPEPFGSVGMHYRDFHQVSDDEVVALLRSVARRDVRLGAAIPERARG